MPMEPASAAARSERMSACTIGEKPVRDILLENEDSKGNWRQLTIRRNDNVQTLRIVNHPDSHGVDKHLIKLHHALILPRNLIKDLIPQHHPVPLRITLRHHRQPPPLPLLRRLKRKPHDPLDPHVRKNRQFRADRVLLVPVRRAALARVLALAVLAHDHPVQQRGLLPARHQRTLRALQNPRGAHVRPLVEFFADRQDHVPQRDVVGHAGPAYRAEVDRVVRFERVKAVRGHVPAAFLVGFAGPVEGVEGEAEGRGGAAAGGRGEFFENLLRGVGDVDADPVAGDEGDGVEGFPLGVGGGHGWVV